MAMGVIISGTPASVLRARAAQVEVDSPSEVLKVKQLREEVRRTPALRKEVETEARQRLELQRDYAFSQRNTWPGICTEQTKIMDLPRQATLVRP